MENAVSKKKRLVYIDVLNICACICVVYMHCNGAVHTLSDTRLWRECMVVETLAYWAVPVFFMITGVTLLGYREKYSTATFFKKRFLKTLIPYIVWSIINVAIKIRLWHWDFDLSFRGIVTMLLGARAEDNYWFFIPLFMIYLSIPVLSLAKDSRKTLIYAASAAFVIYSVYPFLCSLLNIPVNGNIEFLAAGRHIMYVLIGYIIANGNFSKKRRIIIYILGIAGAVLRYVSTVVVSPQTGEIYDTFWGYLNFPTVFLACAVFTAAKHIPWEKLFGDGRLQKLLPVLSSASFGVYLMHTLLIRFLIINAGADQSTYVWRLLMPLVIYAICVAVTLVAKRIPVVKMIVP